MSERVGTFATAASRAKLTQELRGTHFTLGYCKPMNKSMSQQQFAAYNMRDVKDQQAEMFNLRKTNFKLGDTGMETKSSYKGDYPHKGEAQRKISEQFVRDLRDMHYLVGTSLPAMKTTSRTEFTHKQVTVLDKDEKRKIADSLRCHNFSYGEDKPNYSSLMKTTHTPQATDGLHRYYIYTHMYIYI